MYYKKIQAMDMPPWVVISLILFLLVFLASAYLLLPSLFPSSPKRRYQQTQKK